MLTAIIAVAGTLLGALVSSVFQQKMTVQANDLAVTDRLRTERVTAYSEFAQCIADLRGKQLLRWLALREHGESSEEFEFAKHRSWEARTTARGAMYRVQLVTDDAELSQRAEELMKITIGILDAQDAEDRDERASTSVRETNAFVTAASASLRTSPEQRTLRQPRRRILGRR